MSVLTESAIWNEMKKHDDPLVVTPLLEHSQVGEASIDVRLGHEFIVLRRSSVHHVDPTSQDRWETNLYRSQERIRIATFQQFVLHPHDLVLGATLEYLSLPSSVAASVEGRSSWGRLGLIIATASTVAPGFKGCVTLELVNDGIVPIVVYPGMRIAQVVLHRVEGTAKYSGKYNFPTGPEFSKLHEDKEISLWSS